MTDRRITRPKSVLFHAIITLTVLLAIELGLRIAGFEYHNIPRYIQFADDKYKEEERSKGHYDFVPDRQLFWKLAPNNQRLLTNAHGYRGSDFADTKAPGVTRVVSLGCSCTFGILSSYSYTSTLQQLLNKNKSGRRYEVINVGVPGYTSFQGVRLLESEITRYQPDIITVYFGWNDHWLAKYYADKDQKTPSRTAQFLLDHVSRSRLLQALVRLSASIRGLATAHGGPALYRVSTQDYRRNLERILADAEKSGCRVAFITAPTAYIRPGDVPAYLLRDGFVVSDTTLLRIHREYNDIVREVAGMDDALLIDCASSFDANPQKKILFGQDGIHPNDRGHWLIAKDIFRGFVRQGWIDRADYHLEDAPESASTSGR